MSYCLLLYLLGLRNPAVNTRFLGKKMERRLVYDVYLPVWALFQPVSLVSRHYHRALDAAPRFLTASVRMKHRQTS